MNAAESLQQFGLIPPDDALPRIRSLLAQEADAERHGRAREIDLALLCSVQLFSRAQLADVLRIWDAKEAGMDLACSLDVQLLCGAGVEETKQFLSEQTGAAAAQALEYLRKCEAAGDFDGFSPDEHLDHYRRYFGVR